MVALCYVLESFERFDYHGDGFITKEEFAKIVKERKIQVPGGIDKYFEQADIDHSGHISWEEFCIAISQNPDLYM